MEKDIEQTSSAIIANLNFRVSNILDIMNYNLNELYYELNILNTKEEADIIEKVLNMQLLRLKSFIKLSQYTKLKKINDDVLKNFAGSDKKLLKIASIGDKVADKLLTDVLDKKEKVIIPISLEMMRKDYIFINISDDFFYKVIIWIVLRYISTERCIKYYDLC